MRVHLLLLLLMFWPSSARAESSGSCAPSPALQAEIETARRAAAGIADFDANIASFVNIRERHRADVFAHIAYQDAVRPYGVQGQLNALAAEHSARSVLHPDDTLSQFLYGYSLIGTTTPQAIRILRHVLELDSGYAPAHRALAEIYAS